MTEPENFEEDLFADLYDDNDASKGAPAPPPAAAPVNDAPGDSGEAAASMTRDAENAAGGEEMVHDAEDDDDDDEVDFNLGGGSTVAAPAPQHDDTPSTPPYGTVHKASAKEDGKMFIGGLNWETTDQSLRDYFSQFGEVVECTVMRDSSTGRSRGFGFLTFKDAKTVNIVMVKEHFLDGKIIDPKRAIPRDEQEKTSKIFVGGVSQETTDQEFRDYFAQFGRVVDATLMMDKDTGRPRGFGFVTFESEAGVDACINVPLEIHGKPVEVKKAQPRGNLREEEEAAKRNKFRKDEQSGQGGMGGGQQMGGATNGMTPQLMAQYFQRMQQYFNMMQSQMAMNRGMQMNPAMWQQMMQMQQMQQQMMAGRGGGPGGAGNNPQNMMGGGNMNPQMMQQMQQQMMQVQQQQQQQQQGGQQQQPQGGDQGNYGGGFQQAPPQGPGGGRRGGRGGGYGGGGGGGGYGMGGGGGAPTSWEGMYDDVPQPGAGQGGFRRGGSGSQGTPDPQNAPPANAPTGPKNAGRPGANYRGGGRGGNRGFHPYAR
ncbi:hypothetical protein PLIIFM63780_010180 [Purpureocillium lilacinum]|nr:hypothetical protein PLIIFM63780_010180 [Purpureocillium lilacinum]